MFWRKRKPQEEKPVESFYLYSHPFPKDIEVVVSTDSPAHFGPYRHAIDFLMSDGSTVLAPLTGKVVEVRDWSDKGGPSQEFEHYLNYITLSHGNNEFSQLCHIKHRGSLVRVGQIVVEGQPIAYTGSTGWCYEPHLHFMVFKLVDDGQYGFQSLKIRLKDDRR